MGDDNFKRAVVSLALLRFSERGAAFQYEELAKEIIKVG